MKNKGKGLNNRLEFDVIIIGSGIGGLTAAAILAKLNHKRVLVLEKHFQAGGLTHEFQRGNFSWDVGLHYVGEMSQGGLSHQIFDYITDGKVQWQKMPDLFEKFIYPDFSFEVPSDPEEYRIKLEKLFPDESLSICTYFKDIIRVASWNRANIVEKSLPSFIAALVRFFSRGARKTALLTLGDYLDGNFRDTRLKALLASQWGDYGVPPGKAAFAIHALIVNHYLHGGYFPGGGASSIVKAARPVIEREGGAIIVGHSVISLIVKNNVAEGVTAAYENGPDIKTVPFYAPVVISDIGAAETYEKLLNGYIPLDQQVSGLRKGKGLSAVTVYLGLKDTPENLGVHGENYWIYNSYDHDRMADNSNEFLQGAPSYCYISFPSLKTPHPRSHTAEIIAFLDYDFFNKFKSRPWFKRDMEYYELKEKIKNSLIEFANKWIPGFKDLIVYSELSTPLSIENFTSRQRGMMYGVLATPERYLLPELKIKTPVKNFYLTGSDMASVGIVGALMGGVSTSALLNGQFGFLKIISSVKKDPAKRVHYPEIPFQRIHPFSNETSGQLISREILSDHFYEIVFKVPEIIHYVPGQHCYLEADPGEWRPYSIVSAKEKTITFVIDSNPGGAGSLFAEKAALGTVINLRLPSGTLRINQSSNKNIVFAATGSGITPFFSMLGSLKAEERNGKQTILLWGIREEKDEFSTRYLGEAIKRINLLIIPCVSQPVEGSYYHGNVTAKIRELRLDFNNTDFYICGNPGMIDELHSWLRNRGASNIYFEM